MVLIHEEPILFFARFFKIIITLYGLDIFYRIIVEYRLIVKGNGSFLFGHRRLAVNNLHGATENLFFHFQIQ
jgi:hypothetical protein